MSTYVNTLEELLALKDGSVILDKAGYAVQLTDYEYTTSHGERERDRHWSDGGYQEFSDEHLERNLPLMLIYDAPSDHARKFRGPTPGEDE